MGKKYFTEDELNELVRDYDIHTVEGESTRWQRAVTTIVSDKEHNKMYKIDWMKGATENQEDTFLAGWYPEVFSHQQVKGSVIHRFLTEEQINNIDSDKTETLKTEVKALKSIVDSEALANEQEKLNSLDLENLIQVLENIPLVNVNQSLNTDNIIAVEYLKQLKTVQSILSSK